MRVSVILPSTLTLESNRMSGVALADMDLYQAIAYDYQIPIRHYIYILETRTKGIQFDTVAVAEQSPTQCSAYLGKKRRPSRTDKDKTKYFP